MGSIDRNYPDPQPRRAMDQLTPVVKWLLISNIGIYFLDLLFMDHALREWGLFTASSGIMGGLFWELVTFQFLHWNLGHLMFNCIPLFFFGPVMERWWGSSRFIAFYLLCGFAGAFFCTALMAVGWLNFSANTPMAGASAGIYGILIGAACVAPAMQVRLLIPPITLTMRQLAIAILAIAAFFVISRVGSNTGGEAAHLGGAILGFVLVRYPNALQWIRGGALPTAPNIRMPRPTIRREQKIRPRTRVQLAEDDEVDRILDKISQDGFQSLTEAERDTLRKAAESKSSKP